MKAITLLKNQLAPKVTIICYIDRVRIYFDANSKETNLSELLKDNTHNQFQWRSLPHHEYLDRKLELFQPSEDCLKLLADPKIMGGDHAITYVEFAIDFMTDDQQVLEKLTHFFKRHMIYISNKRGGASPIHCANVEETMYFTSRTDKKRLLLYSDKPARKALGQRCLHVEYRLSGWKCVKNQHIVTINDLINFDHKKWTPLIGQPFILLK